MSQARILDWDLPNPGIEPEAPALAGGFFTTEPPGKLSLSLSLYIYMYLVSEDSGARPLGQHILALRLTKRVV